jgi:hypothetical protein
MTTIIRLAIVALLALFLCATGAIAQQQVQPVTLATTQLQANTTNTINAILEVTTQRDVAVMLRFNCQTATNVIPLTMTWDKSVDGVNWSDRDTFSWSYVRDGTTNSINATTNIVVNGYPYFRLRSIVNLGTVGIVNLESLKYYVKQETSR